MSGYHLGHNTGGSSEGGCPALDTGMDAGVVATGEVLFEKSSTGPFVRERVMRYSGSAASSALSAVRGSPSSCASFSVTDPTIGKIDYTVTSLSFASRGDGTAAVRVTATPENYPTVVSYENLVVVRSGNVLIMIAHTATGSIDNGFTNTVVGKAYAKLVNY